LSLRREAVASDSSRPSTSTPLTRNVAVDLMNRADGACPYSMATRGNVEVTLTLAGVTIERQAA